MMFQVAKIYFYLVQVNRCRCQTMERLLIIACILLVYFVPQLHKSPCARDASHAHDAQDRTLSDHDASRILGNDLCDHDASHAHGVPCDHDEIHVHGGFPKTMDNCQIVLRNSLQNRLQNRLGMDSPLRIVGIPPFFTPPFFQDIVCVKRKIGEKEKGIAILLGIFFWFFNQEQ